MQKFRRTSSQFSCIVLLLFLFRILLTSLEGKMGSPYEYQPEVKWYHIIWDMRNKEFRRWFLKKKYRDMRISYKYESHIFYQKVGMGFLMAAVFMSICSSDLAVAVFRWPTEDPNELLKTQVWQKYHNQVNERKEYANKLLQDSNYIHKKNNADFTISVIPGRMSVSRFRHSTGHVAKPQRQLLNVTSSGALWDVSNTIACSDKFVAVPWLTFGGTAVFTHDACGKLPPNPPIVFGQEGPIIDLKFDPFDNQKLYTASEDGSVFGWNIPTDGLESNLSSPLVELRGHNKKCGIISLHPSAKGVLASAGVDRVINVWDVERGSPVTTISHLSEYATGLEWNLKGSLFCITSRDNKLQIMDPRNSTLVSSVKSHASARSQRCIWCKRKDTILTFGCNKSQQREVKLWDPRKMEKAYSVLELDQSSAAFMPVYDEDTNLLFLGSKGEGNLKCLELMDEGLTMSYEVGLPDSVKGVCMMPKWSLDVRRCEFDRLYQLTYNSLLTIEMLLPRKQAGTKFQEDVFPPTFANHAAISADEFFKGTNAFPLEYDLSGLFDGLSPLLIKSDSASQKKSMKLETERPVTELPKTVIENLSPNTPVVVSLEGEKIKAGEPTVIHVDPNSNMTDQEFVDKKVRFQQLSETLRTYHQEIALLRKALEEKEAKMLQVLEDIQSI